MPRCRFGDWTKVQLLPVQPSRIWPGRVPEGCARSHQRHMKFAFIRTENHRDSIPVSRVGRGLTVTGNLDTKGDLHIHGQVLGSVRADRILLAPGSNVEGDIVARDARISGRVLGRVFALNVTFDSAAEVTGRIFHHNAKVARGARIDARMPWRPLNFFETLHQLPETEP